MNLHTARMIVGMFVTRNQKAIVDIAKHMKKNPSELLQEAYIKMGNHKPITAYKHRDGFTLPIGRGEPKKPKFGWVNGRKTTDVQTGYLDDYYEKLFTMEQDLLNSGVEIVTK